MKPVFSSFRRLISTHIACGLSARMAPGSGGHPRAGHAWLVALAALAVMATTMGAATQAHAQFSTITASAGPNGSIDPSGDVQVLIGTDQVFTITPNACFAIQDVVVDGGSVGPVSSYTFSSVTADHTIEASFVSLGPATVALGSDVNPSIWGQAVTFTATVTPSTATGTVTFRDSLTGMCVSVPLSGGTAQCVKSTLFTGNHTAITARYNGDACFDAVTSAPYAQLVHRSASTTSLTSDINPSAFSQNVKLTATVAVSAPTGRVTFTDNSTNPATPLGTAAVNAQGKATLFVQYLATGSHNLQACYPGDTHYEPSCSAEYVQVVDLAATTTVLDPPTPNPMPCRQLVTLRATVSPSDATGLVRFTSNGDPIFPDAEVVNGVATVDYSPTLAGGFTLGASYLGNSLYNVSDAATQPLTVNKAQPTVTLTSDINPSIWGQPVTFRATVTPSSATGTVTFRDSLTIIGTAPVVGGIAQLVRSNLIPGNHTLITATYNGDGCFLTGVSPPYSQQVYRSPSTVSMSTDINPSVFAQTVKFTATVVPLGGTGRVSFYVDGNLIGTGALNALTGLAMLNVDNMIPGDRVLTATYPGDSKYLPSASGPYNQTVNRAPTTVALSSNANPAVLGEPVDLTAAVTPTNATGTVEFFDGATSLGTAPVDAGGVAVLTVTDFAEGTHPLTAVYGGNAVYLGGTSPIYNQDVISALALRTPLAQGVTKLAAVAVELGVRVTWVVANRTAFTTLMLERGPTESGPWTALNVAVREEAGAVVAEDRTAAVGQRYFYRVVGTASGGTQAVFGPVEGTAGAPREFALSGAWPNPSRGALTMAVSVPKAAAVRVSVMDLQGREVAVLADGGFAAGRHEIHWDGRTGGGQAAAGVYFIRCITPERKFVSRVAIAR